MRTNHIYCGSALEILKKIPDEIIDCCVTSPPYYGLRDYGAPEQIGVEKSPQEYIDKLSSVFSEVHRVLKKDGTLWLNLGDTYAYATRGSGGHKTKSMMQIKNVGSYFNKDYDYDIDLKAANLKFKDLMGLPWAIALNLRDKFGWYLRQDIIWFKPNPMPESVKDRCTRSHEYIFLLAKSKKYFFDSDSIKEKASPNTEKRCKYEYFGGAKEVAEADIPNSQSNTGGLKKLTGFRNKRDVWNVNVKPFKGAHFATFPPDLIKPCILAGCPKNGIVLDPFFGSGTVGVVAKCLNRNYVGIDVNPDYCELAEKRINGGI